MGDYTELKDLAECCQSSPGARRIGSRVLFHAAANPAAVLSLIAENDALRKDAERYRWLRKKSIPLEGHDFLSSDEILDYRIDAAMGNGGQS